MKSRVTRLPEQRLPLRVHKMSTYGTVTFYLLSYEVASVIRRVCKTGRQRSYTSYILEVRTKTLDFDLLPTRRTQFYWKFLHYVGTIAYPSQKGAIKSQESSKIYLHVRSCMEEALIKKGSVPRIRVGIRAVYTSLTRNLNSTLREFN